MQGVPMPQTKLLILAAIGRMSEGDRLRVLRFAEFVVKSRHGKRQKPQ